MNWRVVPDEVARQHPLYGVRGWAAVLVFGLTVGTAGVCLMTFARYLSEFLLALNSNETMAKWPLELKFRYLQEFAWSMPSTRHLAFVLVAIFVSSLWLAYLLLVHKPGFRNAVLWTWALQALLVLTLLVYFPPDQRAQQVARMLGAAVWAVPWLIYVVRSRRIRVTCENLVREDDSFLKQTTRPSPPPGLAPRAPRVGRTGVSSASDMARIDERATQGNNGGDANLAPHLTFMMALPDPNRSRPIDVINSQDLTCLYYENPIPIGVAAGVGSGASAFPQVAVLSDGNNPFAIFRVETNGFGGSVLCSIHPDGSHLNYGPSSPMGRASFVGRVIDLWRGS